MNQPRSTDRSEHLLIVADSMEVVHAHLLLVHHTLTNVWVCVGHAAIAGSGHVETAVFMNSVVLMICAALMATGILNAGLSYGFIPRSVICMAERQLVLGNTAVNSIAASHITHF